MTTTTDPLALDDVTCWEDEPCWDCATMGNMICGPTTTVVVVGPPPTLPETGTDAAIGAGLIGTVCLIAGVVLCRLGGAGRRDARSSAVG